jgi:uncharacterized membrane-anchored protein
MLKKLLNGVIAAMLAAALCAPARAADSAASGEQNAAQFLQSLNFQQGDIKLPGDIATLALPPSFRYLPPADTERLLVNGWGNPPGSVTLGMIVPAGVNPLEQNGWGVVITYDKDGHVKDDDADSIKYDDLLKDMQEGVSEQNAARKEKGYPAMTLVGWAERPHYDKARHKLYWAKELRTDGDQQNGLNYNIRVLGREGVLVLNAVAGRDQLEAIKVEMQKVTAVTNFNPGQRYTDFNDSTDKVAEYGLAALVAGGVAAKLGFFGKLLALLLAFKKIILLGAAAFGSAIYKFFKRDQPPVHPLEDAGSNGGTGDKVDLNKR